MNGWMLSLLVVFGWASNIFAQHTTSVAEVKDEVILQNKMGHLLVETPAPNSRVFVNDAFCGVAGPSEPLMLFRVGVGKVVLRVVADGFEAFEREVALQANKWRLVVAPLEKAAPVQAPNGDGVDAASMFGPMVPIKELNIWIDQHEVSKKQFAQFLNAVGNQSEGGLPWFDVTGEGAGLVAQNGRFVPVTGLEDHPITHVSWFGAQAYCEWVGKRLPSETEWAKACQGEDGRMYPWGNDLNRVPANVHGEKDGFAKTAPVGMFPQGASPVGALDMAGNVWEWTASVDSDHQGWHTTRGGGWTDAGFVTACVNRTGHSAASQRMDVGFRCVRRFDYAK